MRRQLCELFTDYVREDSLLAQIPDKVSDSLAEMKSAELRGGLAVDTERRTG